MDAHRGALNSACSIMPALARRYHCFQRRNRKNSYFSEEKSTFPEENTAARPLPGRADPGGERLPFRIGLRVPVLAARMELGPARVMRQRHRQQAALERLSRLLPPIKDQITHLEGLSEEDRNNLSESKMKDYLDQLVKRV